MLKIIVFIMVFAYGKNERLTTFSPASFVPVPLVETQRASNNSFLDAVHFMRHGFYKYKSNFSAIAAEFEGKIPLIGKAAVSFKLS